MSALTKRKVLRGSLTSRKTLRAGWPAERYSLTTYPFKRQQERDSPYIEGRKKPQLPPSLVKALRAGVLSSCTRKVRHSLQLNGVLSLITGSNRNIPSLVVRTSDF